MSATEDASVIQEVRGLAEELSSLRQENNILQANLDELKGHHNNIQTAYDTLASQFHALQNEKGAMEAHHLAQIEGWRHELEAKQGQFEEARAQVMQPRELDKLRKQLLEELETPTREKIRAYECEIEESVERYTQAVRDLESLRTQHDIEVARLLKELEYQRIDHGQELAIARKELEMAEQTAATKATRIEDLEAECRENLQVRANNAALAADNESQRKLRQEAVLAMEKAQTQLTQHSIITDKLERRINSLQTEIEVCNGEYSKLQIKLEQCESGKADLQNRLDEFEFKHRTDLKRAHAEAAKERAELESEFAIEREEAEEKEQAILIRLAAHDASIKKIQDDCDAKVYAAEDSARSARRKAEAGKIEAEIKLDAALTELAACKSDTLKAVGEAEGLRAALAVMEREYANEVPALRADLEQFKKDFAREQLRTTDLKQMLEQERADRVEVGASLVDRDREVRRLLAELERKELKQARDMSTMKKMWQREKDALIGRAKEIAAACEERHRDSLRKAKRKLDGQKRKIAALSMDKVTLLEGNSIAKSSLASERQELDSGGMEFSLFEQELLTLRNRQEVYDKSLSGGDAERVNL